MKKFVSISYFTILFIVTCCTLILANEIIPLRGQGKIKPEIKLLSSTPDRDLVISFTVNAFSQYELNTPQGKAVIVSIPGGSAILKKGAPDLSKLTQPIIVPDTKKMQISVLSVQYREIKNCIIAPSKGTLYRNINPQSVPFSYGNEYDENAFFPPNLAALGEPYIVRDFRGQTVVVYPLQYNPMTRTLRVYTNITVKISSTGLTDQRNIIKKHRKSGFVINTFHKTYERRFINYSSSLYPPLSEKGSMLIICHGDFLEAMTPFVAWKKMKGIPTTIVNVADIGTGAGTIKQYISDYYDKHEDFAFLLLVGDYQQIPTSKTKNGDSDPHYGYIKGNDAYPEIIIGRFSGETTEHIKTQVERSIEYEKNPQIGAQWYQRGIGIASNEGSNPVDWKWMRDVRKSLLDYTFTGIDEMYDGSQGGEDASGNPKAAMVQKALNEGRSIFNYMGHGNTTVLATSGFNNKAVNQLTNENMLPFAWLGACLTGNLKSSTCFAEACLRATNNGKPTGFIGVLGASISHPWVPPMHGAKEMNDILIESYEKNIKRTYGGLCVNGIMHMLDTQGNGGIKSADTWLLFGDPSLVVRTDTPSQMTITHESSVANGADAFTVKCDNKEALISLTVEGEIVGTAEGNGNATTIKIDPPLNTTAKKMQITVTGFNKIPYMKEINIEPTAINPNSDPGSCRENFFILSQTVKKNIPHVYFHFQSFYAGHAQLFIYDLQGNCLFKTSQSFTKKKINSPLFVWKGMADNEKSIAPGIYFSVLYCTYTNGTKKEFRKSFRIID